MDRHLQFMLKQTEDYTKRLSTRIIGANSEDGMWFGLLHAYG